MSFCFSHYKRILTLIQKVLLGGRKTLEERMEAEIEVEKLSKIFTCWVILHPFCQLYVIMYPSTKVHLTVADFSWLPKCNTRYSFLCLAIWAPFSLCLATAVTVQLGSL